jgi:iron complex outermembrane receptor protein
MKRVFLFLFLIIPVLSFSLVYDLGNILISESDYTIGISDFGKSIVTFSGKSIELNGSSNVVDILKNVPGVYFEKANILNFTAGSMATSVFKLRSLGEMPNSGILVLIDDRPQSMALFRHQLFDTLSLDAVDRIDIIKGPASVEYGNQAVAGVISITTKKPKEDGIKTTLAAGIGNYTTQDYYINNMLKSGQFDYSINAGYKSTAGKRPNSDSYQQNYSAKIGYDLDNELRLEANGSYNNTIFFNPGPVGSIWDRYLEACDMKQTSADFRIVRDRDEEKTKAIFYIDAGFNDFFKNSPNYTVPKPVTIPGSDNRFENYGVRLMHEMVIVPGNLTKIGFDWQYFGGRFENYPPNPAFKKVDERHENDYAPYFTIAQKVGMFSIMFGLRYGINNIWGSELIPQAGFAMSLWEKNKIYINVSKGYKTPAMGQVIFNNYEEGLKPESYWQYEAGLEHTIFEILTYRASVYQTEGSNLLQVDPVDNLYKNTGAILFRGVEAGFDLKLFDLLTIGTNASYIDPKDKTANFSYLTGKSYIGLGLLDNNLSLKLEAEFAKDRFASNNRLNKLDDYTIYNASINYNTIIFGNETGFYVDFINLLDKQYEIKQGYPAPGFLVKGGMVVKI